MGVLRSIQIVYKGPMIIMGIGYRFTGLCILNVKVYQPCVGIA